MAESESLTSESESESSKNGLEFESESGPEYQKSADTIAPLLVSTMINGMQRRQVIF